VIVPAGSVVTTGSVIVPAGSVVTPPKWVAAEYGLESVTS
ncbi:hypothetical protein Tco_0621238, partial [Tanacetum coccineum]